MWNMAGCSLVNTGWALRGSDGSFKRCLVVGMRTGCLTRRLRRSGHQGCACQRGATKKLWCPLCPESICSIQLKSDWKWELITLEGCPVHCQSICVQGLWVQSPSHILGKLGRQARSKQINFAFLQKGNGIFYIQNLLPAFPAWFGNKCSSILHPIELYSHTAPLATGHRSAHIVPEWLKFLADSHPVSEVRTSFNLSNAALCSFRFKTMPFQFKIF